MRPSCFVLLLVFAHCAAGNPTRPCLADPEESILVLPGDVSLVLAVPHDSEERLCGVADRRQRDDISFRTDRDPGTSEFAVFLREAIRKRTGSTPTIVRSRLSRMILDPNRASRDGADHPRALRAWEMYHARIAEALTRRGPHTLVEIHSQALFPADVMSRPPDETLRLFLSRLDAIGYGVFGISAAVKLSSMEHSCFLGPCRLSLTEPVPDIYLDGYTARSHRGGSVRSMQLEIHARRLKDPDVRRVTADDFARAVIEAGLLKD